MTGLEDELFQAVIFGLLIVYPTWRIFARAGLNPVWSLLIFVPYVGFLVAYVMLAVMRWPAAEGAERSQDRADAGP